MKNKRRWQVIFVIFLLLLSTVSCKEDDEVTLTKTQLLTTSQWKFQSVSSGDVFLDGLLLELFSGALYTFNGDGNYDFLYPANPTVNNMGQWEFSPSESNLILNKGTVDEEEWIISILNGSQLKFSILNFSNGKSVEFSFIH